MELLVFIQYGELHGDEKSFIGLLLMFIALFNTGICKCKIKQNTINLRIVFDKQSRIFEQTYVSVAGPLERSGP